MRIRPLFGHHAQDLIRHRQSSHLPYQFDALHSPRSIRLLELHPSDRRTDEIRCSLRPFELSQAPPYVSLSYTWGYPLTPFSKTLESFSFRRLDHLRQRAARKESRISLRDGRQGHQTGQTFRQDSRCFPISCNGRTILVTANLYDALRMLRSEYTTSSLSSDPGPQYFWVDSICIDQGNVLERNRQVALMADIFQSARGVIIWLGAEDQFTEDALTTIERLSNISDGVATQGLVAYTDFYTSKWHDAIGIEPLTYSNWLGFLAFINRPWFRRAWVVQELALAKSADLICGSTTISWSKLERALAFIRAKSWYHHLSTEKMRHIRAIQKDPGIYADFLKSRTEFRMCTFSLARTRKLISMSNQHEYTDASKLGRLMQVHRETEAKDPRDKVYAFSGLAYKGCSSVSEVTALAKPDYNLSVEEVYRRAATGFLRAYKDLRILSHVQDASRTKVAGLPSWVPDFSVPLTPYPLAFRHTPCRWSASGGLTWEMNHREMEKGLLHVQGYRAGVVAETAILPQETLDSSAYWTSIVNLAMGLDNYYPLHSNMIDKVQIKQTRLEALWRTLITNTYERKSPASDDSGRAFIDYVLNLQIRHTLAPLSKIDFQPHQVHTESRIPQWHRLLAAEPTDSPYGPQFYRGRMATVMESMLQGSYSPMGLSQLQHDLDIASGSMRRVFRTNTRLLGTGPQSIRKGDEVWVLAKASVPMVLRPLPIGRYQLVGEAYVHGIMHPVSLEDARSKSLEELVLE